MDDRTRGGVDRKRYRVRDRVIYADKLDAHTSELYRTACLDLVKLCFIEQAVLSELVAYESERERSSVDGNIHSRKQKRQSADVVLVSVGEDDTPYLLKILLNISKIGNNKIYSEHIAVRERHSAVDDNDVVFTLDKCDVFADLVKSAQERDFYRRLFHLLGLVSPALLLGDFVVALSCVVLF